jgi:hypothetical protein
MTLHQAPGCDSGNQFQNRVASKQETERLGGRRESFGDGPQVSETSGVSKVMGGCLRPMEQDVATVHLALHRLSSSLWLNRIAGGQMHRLL